MNASGFMGIFLSLFFAFRVASCLSSDLHVGGEGYFWELKKSERATVRLCVCVRLCAWKAPLKTRSSRMAQEEVQGPLSSVAASASASASDASSSAAARRKVVLMGTCGKYDLLPHHSSYPFLLGHIISLPCF